MPRNSKGVLDKESRSIDTRFVSIWYKNKYNLENEYGGGNRSHGLDFGNNYILDHEPDWNRLARLKDDGAQLAFAVHDYQLAVATTQKGVRRAHQNLADASYAFSTPGDYLSKYITFLFSGLSSHERVGQAAGFTPGNVVPDYNVPHWVHKQLGHKFHSRNIDHRHHFHEKHSGLGSDLGNDLFEEELHWVPALDTDLDFDDQSSRHDDSSVAPIAESFGDDDGSVAPIAESFGDNGNALNLHTLHKKGSKRKMDFMDTKKLGVTSVQLGKSNALTSVPSILKPYYKGARTLSNTWHHSGTSHLNKRSSFTYVFRHTVKKPFIGDGDHSRSAILSPSVLKGTTSSFLLPSYPATNVNAEQLGLGKAVDINTGLPDVSVSDANAKTATPSSWDGNVPFLRTAASDQYYDMNLTPGYKANVMAKLNLTLPAGEQFLWNTGSVIVEGDWAMGPLEFIGQVEATHGSLPSQDEGVAVLALASCLLYTSPSPRD